jgi:hypothetical protein
MHRPRFRLLIAALLFSSGSPVFAMLIGDLNVTSNMGDPLNARIAVSTDDDESLRDECFRLAGSSSHTAPLDAARLELVSIGGKRYVSISTRTPVNDPILDLTLRTEGCGPTMQKDFVILLSPKIASTDTTQAAVAPPVMAPSRPFAATRPSQVSARPKAPLHTRSARARRPHRTTLPASSRRLQPEQKQPARFILRLDYGFNSLTQYAEQVAKRKQLAQANAAGKPIPVNPAKPLPGPDLHSQQGQTSQGDKLVLESGSQSVIQPTQPGPQVPAANGVTATTQTNSSNVPAVPAQHGIATNLPAPGATQASKAWYQGLMSSFNLFLLAIFLVLLMALWLKKRSPSGRFIDKTRPDLDTFMPANPEAQRQHALPSHSLPPVDKVLVEPAEAKTLLPESFEFKTETTKTDLGLAEHPDFTPQPLPMSDFTLEQFDSTEHVLELAEVMLAFGRSSQAIDTLSQYIRNNPGQSLEPWLKLLDLYFKANQRNEFEALAADLHKRFNVAIADWTDFESAKGPDLENSILTLESLPHIMERLTAFWGSTDCLNYLDKLLADNRGGQRHGFTLPLVRDILLLRDILRQSGPTPTPIH